MKLRAKLLDIQAGGRSIVLLDDETAKFLGVHSSDRVKIKCENKSLVAIVNTTSDFPRDYIGLFTEISAKLKIKNGEVLEVQPAERPEGINYVKAKIHGERLRENEVRIIVNDVVERHLSDIEIASFVTALHIHGISIDETEALTTAMVETGSTLNFDKKPILDKHSIGGIPGDKTTILVVPIVASAGYIIPKTSSRAITSPAGTADRVEALCPVNLAVEEIREVVNKTNGCMVWGGAVELAPADDIFIQVEYPLSIDPLLLPSIMSKKKAIGATNLVLDIPTGRGAKIKTIGKAQALAYDFIDLGKRLGINVQCAVTFGEQPLGYAIGPALEAREAISAIMGKGPADLLEKAKNIAGIFFEMFGIQNGKEKAEHLLKSGKAERKLREIIEAQGGNPDIGLEDIKIGDKREAIRSNEDGKILWINNRSIAEVAKVSGAPKEKGAGIVLNKKIGDQIKKGEVIFEIYAERNTKLEAAIELSNKLNPIGLSKQPEESMLMDRIPPRAVHWEPFMLDR